MLCWHRVLTRFFHANKSTLLYPARTGLSSLAGLLFPTIDTPAIIKKLVPAYGRGTRIFLESGYILWIHITRCQHTMRPLILPTLLMRLSCRAVLLRISPWSAASLKPECRL